GWYWCRNAIFSSSVRRPMRSSMRCDIGRLGLRNGSLCACATPGAPSMNTHATTATFATMSCSPLLGTPVPGNLARIPAADRRRADGGRHRPPGRLRDVELEAAGAHQPHGRAVAAAAAGEALPGPGEAVLPAGEPRRLGPHVLEEEQLAAR